MIPIIRTIKRDKLNDIISIKTDKLEIKFYNNEIILLVKIKKKKKNRRILPILDRLEEKGYPKDFLENLQPDTKREIEYMNQIPIKCSYFKKYIEMLLMKLVLLN